MDALHHSRHTFPACHYPVKKRQGELVNKIMATGFYLYRQGHPLNWLAVRSICCLAKGEGHYSPVFLCYRWCTTMMGNLFSVSPRRNRCDNGCSAVNALCRGDALIKPETCIRNCRIASIKSTLSTLISEVSSEEIRV